MTTVFEELGDQYGAETLAPTDSTGITKSIRLPTSGLYTGMMAKAALIVVETQAIRFRMDGADPTATTGPLISAGQNYVVKGRNNVKNFKCIDTAAGASSVKVLTFF